jgi:hypothetical protein
MQSQRQKKNVDLVRNIYINTLYNIYIVKERKIQAIRIIAFDMKYSSNMKCNNKYIITIIMIWDDNRKFQSLSESILSS